MLMERLEAQTGHNLSELWDEISEIRLRGEKPLRLRFLDGSEQAGPVISTETVRSVASILMENSVYAREEELKQGFFTSENGCRVGVCGKMSLSDGRITALSSVSSLCIRIPRQIKGCANALVPMLSENMLILSPPGLGKTTLLRDLARQASDGGMNVAIADERREICACVEGIPQLDVGCRTDVMDGCPKSVSIPMMIRACAPDLIVADEIGGPDDALALTDAVRCGVKIVATAHASSIEDAMKRKHIGELMSDGTFSCAVLLGGSPGNIAQIQKLTCGVGER